MASRDEAIAWAKRIPFHKLPTSGRVPEVEIRQFFELSDFPEVPPAVAELERRFEAERGQKE